MDPVWNSNKLLAQLLPLWPQINQISQTIAKKHEELLPEIWNSTLKASLPLTISKRGHTNSLLIKLVKLNSVALSKLTVIWDSAENFSFYQRNQLSDRTTIYRLSPAVAIVWHQTWEKCPFHLRCQQIVNCVTLWP